MKSWPKGAWLAVALLIIGYSGYYLCRSNFSVAKPLLLAGGLGLTKESLGQIASIGTLLYALGKFFNGAAADRFGGKTLFLLGMIGAILFTLLFPLGGPPLFLAAWAGNRLVQSAGWGGMVKIVGQWFGQSVYGQVMGLVSLSYLFGDFASRLLLGSWVKAGATWQNLFFMAAAGLALILLPCVFLLKEKGPIPVASPVEKTPGKPISARTILFALPQFWVVCVLSFSFTLLRETFNEWTPLLLTEMGRMEAGAAGQASSLFPLFGGLSVIAVGFWSDRMARRGGVADRLKVIPFGLLLGAGALVALTQGALMPPAAVIALLCFVAFVLIGPYSLLAGAISLDFGGKELGATAAGWIDGIGYIGGILSGWGVASLAQRFGWPAAMASLAGLCVVTACVIPIIAQMMKKQAIPTT